MTRIDFYILPEADERQRALTACRLAEKAYQQDYRIFIHTASAQAARDLDDLLWSFRAGSFLPHGLTAETDAEPPPILIAHDSEPTSHIDLLINLTDDVPGFFSRFERLVEIIDQQADNLQRGRERYRFYQERGYQLHSHKL